MQKRYNYLTQEMLDHLIPELQQDHSEFVIATINEDFYTHEVQDNGDIIVRLIDKWKEVEHKTEEDGLNQIQESNMD